MGRINTGKKYSKNVIFCTTFKIVFWFVIQFVIIQLQNDSKDLFLCFLLVQSKYQSFIEYSIKNIQKCSYNTWLIQKL